jgi:hypothetical protein
MRGGWATSLFLVFAFASMPVSHADEIAGKENLPPIRAFDIPTIEWLGRAMYDQDQEAWKATDVLKAQHDESELKAAGLHGWIVESIAGQDVVRFVRESSGSPEAYYDVTFPKNSAPQLSTPPATVLSPEELGQYRARRLALASGELNCAKTYNTVALKDPQSSNWLVWVMAATIDSDAVMIGRHYRFTISADGNSVIQKDALSRGCLKLSKKSMNVPDGSTLQSMFVSHLVSLTPIETHVFANLSYHLPLYVGTQDGTTWKIDRGRLHAVGDDDPDADGIIARAFEGNEEHCVSLLESKDEAGRKYFVGPETHVINPTEKAAKFDLGEIPDDRLATGVICGRLSIVPAPNDFKVILAGLALTIVDKGEGHPKRVGILEAPGGHIAFTLKDGPPLTDDLKTRVGKRLDSFQLSAQPGARPTAGHP